MVQVVATDLFWTLFLEDQICSQGFAGNQATILYPGLVKAL